MRMAIAQSRLTSQGQVSIPAEVRKRLGLGPGSDIEWDQQGDLLVVRKAGRSASIDVHMALFEGRKPAKAEISTRAGIADYMRRKHARR